MKWIQFYPHKVNKENYKMVYWINFLYLKNNKKKEN